MSTEPVTTPAPEPIKPFTELVGHTSPETAYTVEDYPYGFRLRTRSAIGSKHGGPRPAGHESDAQPQTRG